MQAVTRKCKTCVPNGIGKRMGRKKGCPGDALRCTVRDARERGEATKRTMKPASTEWKHATYSETTNNETIAHQCLRMATVPRTT
eukprot:1687833-Pleurochrysis_carterae.AAC.1